MKGKKTLKENDACKRVQRLEKAMQSYMAERERERGGERDGQYDSRETFVASRREVERGRRDRDRRSSISIKTELVPRFFFSYLSAIPINNRSVFAEVRTQRTYTPNQGWTINWRGVEREVYNV